MHISMKNLMVCIEESFDTISNYGSENPCTERFNKYRDIYKYRGLIFFFVERQTFLIMFSFDLDLYQTLWSWL